MHYTIKQEIPIYNIFIIELIVSDEVDKINEQVEGDEKKFFACVWKTNHSAEVDGEKFDRKGVTVILNPNYNKQDKITIGIIAHEAIHVKNMVFEGINYKPKTNNDEAEAYFMEWIMDFLYINYSKFLEEEKLRKEVEDAIKY